MMVWSLNKICPFFLLILFLIVIQPQVYGQVRFDYITDWSNIFLSNIDMISTESYSDSRHLSEDSEHNIRFSSRLIFNDFYRERQGNRNRNISYFRQYNTLHSKIRINKQNFGIGLQYGISQKNMHYDLTESQSVHLRGNFKEYRIFVITSLLQSLLTFRGGIGAKVINSSRFNTWNIGVTFQPIQSVSFSYHRYEDFFRWEYHLDIDNTAEYIRSDEYSDLEEYKMLLNLFPQLTISASMQNNYINKDREAESAATILVPTGAHYQRNVLLCLFPRQNLSLILSYYNRNHNLTGYFYDDYQVFGKITEQRDHSDHYQSEVFYKTKYHKMGLIVGWASGMICGNGHLESWPFTPTTIDLLGLRYNFRSNFDYELVRLGASYNYHNSDWTFSFRTIFERIQPDGGARSWQPDMLVFGVKNLNVFTFSQEFWDGLYIGLQLGKSIGSLFQLTYEFHQYIPLEFNGKSGQDVSASDNDRIRKSVYGGGKHRVYLTISL